MARIYLAGAMGCYGKNYEKSEDWRKKATSLFHLHGYHKVFDPTLYYRYGCDYHKTEKEIMRYELAQLKKCDVCLVNLDDYDKSVGTIQEIFYAFQNNIPIVGFMEKYKIENIHPWIIEECTRIEDDTSALDDAVCYINGYF